MEGFTLSNIIYNGGNIQITKQCAPPDEDRSGGNCG